MASFKILILSVLFAAISLSNGNPTGRIFGGEETTIERRNYMASLQLIQGGTVEHLCSATIISTKFMLTTWRCPPRSSGREFLWARVGSTRYNSGGELYKVVTFVAHPNFNGDNFDHDVALVVFDAGVEIALSPRVGLVRLSDGEELAEGAWATVPGWGAATTQINAPMSENLREGQLDVLVWDTCRRFYVWMTRKTSCMGGNPSASACFGDLGSPAIRNDTQYGIFSGALECGLVGIFGQISANREWIRSMTGV